MNLLARTELFVFPMAALFNSFSMTGLLLVFGIAGYSEVAADIGLIQGATLALFYAFSANARNLILADTGGAAARRLMQARLMLMLPLAAASWGLSVGIGGVSQSLAAVLILRRIAEWMGEIGLARHERMGQLARGQQALVAEGVSLALCILLPLLFGFDLAVSAIPWMLAPLVAMRRMELGLRGERQLALRALLPHLGATAIIGASVYVFRISIVSLTGKVLAGELFTAFAIGGMIPTIFGHAIAPTLAHRFGTRGWPRRLLALPGLMFLLGAGIAALAVAGSDLLLTIGRSSNFWLAVGLSLAGGAFMVIAAVLRTRLIHGDDGREVFGPDLLANVLIATCVPFVFHLFGAKSLAALYLVSACLSLGFLWGAGHGRGIPKHRREPALFVIGVLLVVPVFFQIGGGLFDDPAMVFDSGGSLIRLPIPLSVVALFAGIALLGNYATATRTLLTLFFSALLLVTTSMVVTEGYPQSQGSKFILLAQFLLPMFGLILGEMYGAATAKPIFEYAALSVLAIVLPAQLVATWMEGFTVLQPKVFVFSIYQHLQYFPMIVSGLIAMIGMGLWQQAGLIRLALMAVLPVAMIHLAASLSISAVVGGGLGIASITAWYWRKGVLRRSSLSMALASVLCASGYLVLAQSGQLSSWVKKEDLALRDELSWQVKVATVSDRTSTPVSTGLGARVNTWHFYASGIADSPSTFLFGHTAPPDRSQYPSAHNYWLDAIYNFGLLAMLPLIALLGVTGRLLFQARRPVFADPLLLGTALAVIYLVLGESLIKVGMRQPYPGIVTFFIWGLLIARLRGVGARAAGSVAEA